MNWWQVIVLASRKRKPLQEEKHHLFMGLDVGNLMKSGVYLFNEVPNNPGNNSIYTSLCNSKILL